MPLLFLSTSAGAVTAYEAPPGAWVEKSFGVSVSSEYFSSKANYDSSRGGYVRLVGDSKYSSFDTKFRGRYNFSQKVSAFGGFGLGYASATDLFVEKTNSQLTELVGGVDFLLSKRFVYLIPELMFSFPMSRTDAMQTAPLTSDGVTYMRAGLYLHKPYKKFRLGAFGGAQIPLEDLATRVVFEVTADMRLFKVMTFGGGISGYESVLADRGTQLGRSATAARSSAGSYRYYSFEPSLLEARGWLGFRPDKSLWIRAGLGKTINGIRAAEGFSVLFSVAYNSPKMAGGSDSEAPPRLRPNERPDEETAARGFVPSSEPTDQEAFESEAADVLPRSKKGELDQFEKMLEEKSKPKD